MVTFRALRESDRPLLEAAIANEPFHRVWLKSDFFFHPLCMTVIGSDDYGPILFLRMRPEGGTVHMFAQFICFDRLRSAKAICEGFKTVKSRLKAAGLKTIIIDTTSPSLARLCQKRLGFIPHPSKADHYVLPLGPYET